MTYVTVRGENVVNVAVQGAGVVVVEAVGLTIDLHGMMTEGEGGGGGFRVGVCGVVEEVVAVVGLARRLVLLHDVLHRVDAEAHPLRLRIDLVGLLLLVTPLTVLAPIHGHGHGLVRHREGRVGHQRVLRHDLGLLLTARVASVVIHTVRLLGEKTIHVVLLRLLAEVEALRHTSREPPRHHVEIVVAHPSIVPSEGGILSPSLDLVTVKAEIGSVEEPSHRVHHPDEGAGEIDREVLTKRETDPHLPDVVAAHVALATVRRWIWTVRQRSQGPTLPLSSESKDLHPVIVRDINL